MQARSHHPRSLHSRRGILAPAVAMALLTALAALALVVDRLWLEAARGEMRRAAEAAALAACRQLAATHIPSADASGEAATRQAVLESAARIARQNTVAGRPLVLDTSPDGDILIGRYITVEETGEKRFLQTVFQANVVRVIARRTRSRSNPVALLLSDLIGRRSADVVVAAEASVEDRIVGVRPLKGVPAPVMPIALFRLRSDNHLRSDKNAPTTVRPVPGADAYSWDPHRRRVWNEPDGLSEWVVVLPAKNGNAAFATAVLVDLGNGLDAERLAGQVRRGISREEAEAFGGRLQPSAASPLVVPAVGGCPPVVARALDSMVGKLRVWAIGEPVLTADGGKAFSCHGLIGARLMAVTIGRDGSCRLVLQPETVVTRTAIVGTDPQTPAHPYLRKVYLSQ